MLLHATVHLARVCCCTLVVVSLLAVFSQSASAAVPDASNFSRAISLEPDGVRTASSSTRTIAPGRAFQIVGFRWTGSGTPRILVQSEGPRGWSDWTEPKVSGIDGPDPASAVDRAAIRSSEPVWTGFAKRVRVRISGRGFSNLRASFVRVSGSIGWSVGVAATGGARPTGGSGKGNRSSAAQPAIITRSQWDPRNRCKPKVKPIFGEVISTVVHHTVSTNSYSQGEAASVVLGICRYHRYSRKWNDLGYNLLIDRFGRVYEGRGGGVDKPVVGAHTQGYNGQTSGIALIGSFMSTAPPQATLAALRQTLAWKLELAGISRNERVPLISTGGKANKYKNGQIVFARPVAGHRDLDFTDCPGNNLYGRLNEAQEFLTGRARTVTKLTARLKRVSQGNGQAVQISGRLTAAGAPSVGKQIALEIFTRAGWSSIGEATTDAAGIWRIVIAPKNRYWMRGRYSGSDDLRAVRSRWYYSPKIRRATEG